jgi:hypothetical protein
MCGFRTVTSSKHETLFITPRGPPENRYAYLIPGRLLQHHRACSIRPRCGGRPGRQPSRLSVDHRHPAIRGHEGLVDRRHRRLQQHRLPSRYRFSSRPSHYRPFDGGQGPQRFRRFRRCGLVSHAPRVAGGAGFTRAGEACGAVRHQAPSQPGAGFDTGGTAGGATCGADVVQAVSPGRRRVSTPEAPPQSGAGFDTGGDPRPAARVSTRAAAAWLAPGASTPARSVDLRRRLRHRRRRGLRRRCLTRAAR